MDNNEVINNSDTKDGVSNVSEDKFIYLEHLLTDKKEKVRDYSKIKKYYDELLTNDQDNSYAFKTFISLLFKGDIKVVEGFFEQEWKVLSSENKAVAIEELLFLPAEKGTVRQAAVAQKIVTNDSEIASKIIYHILGGEKHKPNENGFSGISKDKKDALKSRFFPEKGSWNHLKSSDEDTLRVLILFFSELADGIEEFGKGPYIGLSLHFAKWIINSAVQVNFDTDSISKIESRLNKIIKRLPQVAQDELSQLKSKTLGNDGNKTHSENNKEVSIVENTSTNEPQELKNQDSTESALIRDKIISDKPKTEQQTPPVKASEAPVVKASESNNKKNSEAASAFQTPEQLLKEKQEVFNRLAKEIEVLTKLIAERDALLTKQKELLKRLDSAYDEVENREEQLKKLRKNYDEIEATLTQTINERDRAIASKNQLSEELAGLKKELEQKTTSLESERSEYAKSSKDEVEFEIENFKGSLKQKLRPIFENKRQTDKLPNDEKLAEFLREWFSEIENILNKSGVNP